MARPPAVTGGRPNRVTVRFSNSEIAELDKRRAGLNRPDYLRQMALHAPKFATAEVQISGHHTHKWRRYSNLLDDCDCGEQRPHQAGTR